MIEEGVATKVFSPSNLPFGLNPIKRLVLCSYFAMLMSIIKAYNYICREKLLTCFMLLFGILMV